jgi:hypothetical protein
MRTYFSSALDCAVNGVSLTGLSGCIFVEDISEEIGMLTETTRTPGSGLHVIGHGRDTLTVKITVYIKTRGVSEPGADQYTLERYSILEKMLQWAKNGYLTVSYRNNQRLYAYCTKPPSFSILTPQTRIELAFTAYDDAVWESTQYTEETGTAVIDDETAELTVSLTPAGTKDPYLEAEIVCPAGTTYVKITAGGRFILLSRLVIESETTITIGRDAHHRITISDGTHSLLGYRSAESADDLILTAGAANEIGFESDAACSVTFKTRGLYR